MHHIIFHQHVHNEEEGEDNGEKRENSIGRNQDYSSLSRELARLRASLFQAEWQRIMLEAKQKMELKNVKNSLSPNVLSPILWSAPSSS